MPEHFSKRGRFSRATLFAKNVPAHLPGPPFQQPRLISTVNFRLARENEAARAAVAAACKRRNCPLEERMEPEVDAACASTNESSMTTKVIARRIDRDCKLAGGLDLAIRGSEPHLHCVQYAN